MPNSSFEIEQLANNKLLLADAFTPAMPREKLNRLNLCFFWSKVPSYPILQDISNQELNRVN
jgi:hypothetical protein